MIHRWWAMLNYYPSDQLRFIMTDVNTSSWLRIRLRHHCPSPANINEACYLPAPLPFFPPSNNSMSKQLADATMMRTMHESSVITAMEAYRNFVKCTVPSDKLLWLDFSKLNDSSMFWNKLISFLDIKVSKEKIDQFVSAGIPYYGRRGCLLGTRPCSYVPSGTLRISEGVMSGVMVPSICI